MNDDKKLDYKMTETDDNNRINVERQIIYEFTASEESDFCQKEELKCRSSTLLNQSIINSDEMYVI